MGIKSISLAIITLVLSNSANASVITFDDISGGSSMEGYKGLNWRYINVLNTTTYSVQDSGYIRGVVSPENVAVTSGSAEVFVSSGTFDFTGMYITAAWQNGLTVQLKGLLSGSVLFEQELVIDDDSPIFTNSNFIGIDSLTITTIDGVDAGTPGAGRWLAMDNFTLDNVSVVPVPAAVWLFGSGLLGLVGVARRKQV